MKKNFQVFDKYRLFLSRSKCVGSSFLVKASLRGELYVFSDKTVRLNKLIGSTYSEVASLSEHTLSVTGVEFARSGSTFLAGANDGSIVVWHNPVTWHLH